MSAADAIARRFAAAMAAAEPFEAAPQLAVAFSGGADSTALLVLARAWAEARGGTVSALTVDHRLRAESGAEASSLAASCAAEGIAHATLVREGPRPTTGVQRAAREARHRLLLGWCREHGVLHLLLGHHADDQAETRAMRASRGSGADGLAGMAAVVERRDARLLRPLLGVPAASLRIWLARRQRGWIEDPSNADPRFTRARLRAAGTTPIGPRGEGRSRAAREAERAGFLARHAFLHEDGWIALDAAALAALPVEVVTAVLGGAIAAVGGRDHPPRAGELERLVAALAGGEFRGCTLGLCRIGRARGRVTLRPEAAGAPGPRTRPGSLDHGTRSPHLFCGRVGGGLDTVDPANVFRPPRPLAGAPFAPAAEEPDAAPGPTSEGGLQPLARPDAA